MYIIIYNIFYNNEDCPFYGNNVVNGQIENCYLLYLSARISPTFGNQQWQNTSCRFETRKSHSSEGGWGKPTNTK